MSGETGLARLERTFAGLRARHRPALILYLMAGDPDPDTTVRLVAAVAEAGADVVELGFPFSDPVADGPVIQAAGQRAFPHVSDLEAYLALVRRVRAASDVALVTMTYYNPVFRYGEQAFLEAGRAAGLDGAIVPDLPYVEAGDWLRACRETGMGAILLEAPNTTDEDARSIAAAATGFLYMVSLKGVTGAEQELGDALGPRVERLRRYTDTPLAVGFGISTPEQARAIGRQTDGVVIGSSLINRLVGKSPAEAEAVAREYVAALRAALDAP